MNYSYRIDDKILNYTGSVTQNLFVRKMVVGSETTYTVSPIQAKSKLGLWLQEHSHFFNSIFTWFLSKSLQKDPDCLILKSDRINQEPNHILDKIVHRIVNNPAAFFQDNDVENVLKTMSTGIINSANVSDGKKIEYISRIIENHYKGKYTFDDTDLKEVLNSAIALIHGGPYTQNQIDQIVVPLAELIKANDDDKTAKEDLVNFLTDCKFWNKKDIFKVSSPPQKEKQYDLALSLDLVKKSPERILELFHKECFSKDYGVNKLNIIPLNDSFKTEKGKNQAEDKGGPSRQFLVSIFESLVKNSGKIHFEKTKSGFYIPKALTTRLDRKEEDLYEAIGKLMGMCLTSKGYLLMGQIFDASVYEIMTKIYPFAMYGNLNDDSYVEIYKITKGNDEFVKKYRSLKNNYPSDEQLREAYDLADSMYPDWPNSLNPNSPYSLRQHQHVILGELKKIMVEEAQANGSIQPIFKMCQGMSKHFRNLVNAHNYNSPANMDGEEMLETIQGKFSKELVKESLMFLKDEHKNKTVDEYQRIQDYFNRWIDESDEEQVRKFLMITTGSNTIGFEAGIDMNIVDYNKYVDHLVWPKSNSCTKQMTIQNYPNYELFKKKLDETILNAELTDMGFDKE